MQVHTNLNPRDTEVRLAGEPLVPVFRCTLKFLPTSSVVAYVECLLGTQVDATYAHGQCQLYAGGRRVDASVTKLLVDGTELLSRVQFQAKTDVVLSRSLAQLPVYRCRNCGGHATSVVIGEHNRPSGNYFCPMSDRRQPRSDRLAVSTRCQFEKRSPGSYELAGVYLTPEKTTVILAHRDSRAEVVRTLPDFQRDPYLSYVFERPIRTTAALIFPASPNS